MLGYCFKPAIYCRYQRQAMETEIMTKFAKKTGGNNGRSSLATASGLSTLSPAGDKRPDRRPAELIERMQDLQEAHGFLPETLLRDLACELEVAPIEVYRVASFYRAFSLKPKGRHLITLCNGTACHVRGSSTLLETLRTQVGIGPGETSEDGRFTVQTVNCLGACALGPIAVIDGRYHHHVNPAKLRALIRELSENGE